MSKVLIIFASAALLVSGTVGAVQPYGKFPHPTPEMMRAYLKCKKALAETKGKIPAGEKTREFYLKCYSEQKINPEKELKDLEAQFLGQVR